MKSMPGKQVDFDVVRKIAMALPDVEESNNMRGTSLKLRGKLLTCQAINKSAEPNSLVVRIDPDRRAELIAAVPDIYYVTDHYVKHPAILVRLSRINLASLEYLLSEAWHFVNSKAQKSGRKT